MSSRMTLRNRMGRAAAISATGAVLTLALVLGCAGGGRGPSESTVTLSFQTLVGAVEANTAIIRFAVTPQAPATMSLPATASLRVTDARGKGSAAAPTLGMNGFIVDTPVIISSVGRATMTLLASQSTGTRQATTEPMRIEDGFGNSLELRSLSVAFDNEARGVTTLPSSATLTTPLAGGPLSLGSAVIRGLTPQTRVAYSVAFGNEERVEDEGTADTGGSVVFSLFPTGVVDDVTSATVTFGPDAGE